MTGRGKIKQISYGLSGGYTVLLELTEARLEELKNLEPEDLTVELKKYRAKRSLDANAYFHVLVGKIADAIGRSRHFVKNDLIGKYGQPEIIDGKNAYLTTQIQPEKMQEQEALHTILVSTNAKGNLLFFNYMVMRGSHTYDTKEMARLIEGTVQEAKDLGIETLTPAEIERMELQWIAKNA